ncbi:ATP synthase A chain [Liberibacter crescens BT-1]|uniref:ATP synthase subunit a n=1 Tax=Liberibacter crescens (strain BT-1) TaxID=1215343 RepID=L0EUT8_LIBCB|nr:F0F1 ATP synthase subunit A [Liberibacter crescens]AGA64727.1 ATP synthase A chain [Liberibacter crescens BT-1]
MAKDPLSQFVVKKIIPIEIGGIDFSFTNSSLSMLITAVIILGVFYIATIRCKIIPTPLQSIVEMLYQFIETMLVDSASSKAKRFLPFIFSVFIFILAANCLGMFPYLFSFTSQVVVTASFSCIIILMIIFYGFYLNGFRFLKLFIPSGLPSLILPLVALIELTSFLSRPISLSLRLFANMLAGHIMLKVFSGFVISLVSIGWFGAFFSFVPLTVNVAITGLEFFVAFMQAYIFTVLTCLYFNDVFNCDH